MKTCKECKWFKSTEDKQGKCFAWGFSAQVRENEKTTVDFWPIVWATQRECFRFAVIGSNVSHYTKLEIPAI